MRAKTGGLGAKGDATETDEAVRRKDSERAAATADERDDAARTSAGVGNADADGDAGRGATNDAGAHDSDWWATAEEVASAVVATTTPIGTVDDSADAEEAAEVDEAAAAESEAEAEGVVEAAALPVRPSCADSTSTALSAVMSRPNISVGQSG